MKLLGSGAAAEGMVPRAVIQGGRVLVLHGEADRRFEELRALIDPARD